MKRKNKAAQSLGRLGGRAKSPAKSAAAQANGRKAAAAERDRLKASNAQLLAALENCIGRMVTINTCVDELLASGDLHKGCGGQLVCAGTLDQARAALASAERIAP